MNRRDACAIVGLLRRLQEQFWSASDKARQIDRLIAKLEAAHPPRKRRNAKAA